MTGPALPPDANAATAFSVSEHRDRHAFYAEVLGNGLFYSLNYERIFAPFSIGIRVGASFVSYKVSVDVGAGSLTIATLPIVLSYYFGSEHHKVQLGLGATFLYTSASSDSAGIKFGSSGPNVEGTAVIGYRYFPRRTGFTFGAGFTPLLRAQASNPVLPWGAVSAGAIF